MFQSLLRIAIVGVVVKALKPRSRGLAISAIIIIATLVAHGEYLSYVELSQDDTYLAKSYWFKYTAIIIAVVLYFVFGEFYPKRQAGVLSDCGASASAADSSPRQVDDGFDFIREEERLLTRAEKILSQAKNDER
jgi:hypothetical protein